CDYYNANASSMVAALENIEAIQTDLKKTIILGDMFELGEESAEEHRKLIDRALLLKECECVFVGKAFYEYKNDRASFWKTTGHAVEALKSGPLKNRLILMKASRGMVFEDLLAVL